MTVEAPISTETFRQTMRRLAGGVCIAATGQDGQRLGLTVTAVCSVTLEPPTILLCVNRTAGAHDLIRATRRVGISVLASDQLELAQRFSSSEVKGSARFQDSMWTDMASGTPAAVDALAALDCEIVHDLSIGQHSVFVCEVRAARLASEKPPLVHFDRAFRALSPL
jgi:flavin reductase (DIM6/NTAB) family NADH-FMN oxidoreductase RutF